jgi:hypothetical protein
VSSCPGTVQRVEEPPDGPAKVPFGGNAFEFGARPAGDGAEPGAGFLEGGQVEVPHKPYDGGSGHQVIGGGFQLGPDR